MTPIEITGLVFGLFLILAGIITVWFLCWKQQVRQEVEDQILHWKARAEKAEAECHLLLHHRIPAAECHAAHIRQLELDRTKMELEQANEKYHFAKDVADQLLQTVKANIAQKGEPTE